VPDSEQLPRTTHCTPASQERIAGTGKSARIRAVAAQDSVHPSESVRIGGTGNWGRLARQHPPYNSREKHEKRMLDRLSGYDNIVT